MCDVIINIVKTNTDKIWTLLATFLGAFISFKATTASEKRKEKRETQLTTLHEILIPLCQSIEKVINIEGHYKNIGYEQLDRLVKAPSEFLKVEKRIFLSSHQKKLLELYMNTVGDFYKIWEEDQLTVIKQYHHWISENVINCPGAPVAKTVDIGMDKIECQMDVLGKKANSYKDKIKSVTFILDDEPEDYQIVFITFDDIIRNTCLEIESGVKNIENIDNYEDQLACNVYIKLMSLDDKKAMRIILDSTKTDIKFFELLERAKALQKCLINDIDKVTLHY